MPYDFFVYIWDYKSINSWLVIKDYSLECISETKHTKKMVYIFFASHEVPKLLGQ